MLISTKGRYALRLMLDIATHQQDGPISLKTIANRQNISLKYLEAIASSLHADGLLLSSRGKTGGYRLAKEPGELFIGNVLNTSQGGLNTVECSHGEGCTCGKDCLTKPLWIQLDKLINDFFNSISLQDLLNAGKQESPTIELLRKEVHNESICR
ncbi:MAG: Rrf2 family transcriptional regulator [Eubacteriales bacterium]|nr:Rrf2 family transcriptional regulator [Eubacteriales bacterium]